MQNLKKIMLLVSLGIASVMAQLNFYGQPGVSNTFSAKPLGHAKMSIGFAAEGHMDQSVFTENAVTGSKFDYTVNNTNTPDKAQTAWGQASVSDYQAVTTNMYIGLGLGSVFDFSVSLPVYWENPSVDVGASFPQDVAVVYPKMNKAGMGDLRLNTKLRVPFPEDSPVDIAALFGVKFNTNSNNQHGPWIREITNLNYDSAMVYSYGNGVPYYNFGVAFTSDMTQLPTYVPLIFHFNYMHRYSSSESFSSSNGISTALIFKFENAQFLRMFAEYTMEILSKEYTIWETGSNGKLTPSTSALPEKIRPKSALLSAGAVIHTDIGFDIGLGLGTNVGSTEIKNVRLPTYEYAGSEGEISYNVVAQPKILVKLNVSWSGYLVPQDDDDDGINNKDDKCPNDPEDFDEFEDHDGCPELDNDGDGFSDDDDECPNQAEDVDGFMDEDGCPDPDNDGDGVSDANDKCPLEPEDVDGFEDNDGCPDPDNDRDGLSDEEDACPDHAETVNGVDDEDGCPEGDSDGDGILDADDKCPNQAEDRDGFEDKDGCPDPDNDGDGILDVDDKCPIVAETVNGIEDEDGCPEGDSDNDGFLDADDKCPNQAEDVDGFKDEDGCPDSDNDKDGMLDSLDKCPLLSEDYDGFEDKDGCPDPDNDGDGVLDTLDKCPNEPETMNGVEDEDGCPDESVPEIKNVVLDGVNFKTGTADLTFEAKQILNGVVEQLKTYPKVEIEIIGHTDSQGGDSYNQKLSQSRAQSVVDYFMSNGVSSSRMKASGHGEKNPIATNNTADGRAKNRRIEMYRLK